jgi:uncharacterized protein (TIGR03067 family)
MKLCGLLMLLTGGLLLAVQLPAQTAPPRPADPDLAKLQGTWSTVSLISNGRTIVAANPAANLPPQPGPVTALAYEGDHWLVLMDGQTVATGITRLDSSKTPKEIDILDASGTKTDKSQLGIYELDGDTYKYCLASPGKPRPTAFASPEGSGISLGVSRRKKP